MDVPGYGWSKAGHADRAAWRKLVDGYVTERTALRGVLWLLDIRHEPSVDDRAFGALLAQRRIPVLPVLTKADKIGRSKRDACVAAIARALDADPGSLLVTSAHTREGQEALRDAVLAFVA